MWRANFSRAKRKRDCLICKDNWNKWQYSFEWLLMLIFNKTQSTRTRNYRRCKVTNKLSTNNGVLNRNNANKLESKWNDRLQTDYNNSFQKKTTQKNMLHLSNLIAKPIQWETIDNTVGWFRFRFGKMHVKFYDYVRVRDRHNVILILNSDMEENMQPNWSAKRMRQMIVVIWVSTTSRYHSVVQLLPSSIEIVVLGVTSSLL